MGTVRIDLGDVEGIEGVVVAIRTPGRHADGAIVVTPIARLGSDHRKAGGSELVKVVRSPVLANVLHDFDVTATRTVASLTAHALPNGRVPP